MAEFDEAWGKPLAGREVVALEKTRGPAPLDNLATYLA